MGFIENAEDPKKDLDTEYKNIMKTYNAFKKRESAKSFRKTVDEILKHPNGPQSGYLALFMNDSAHQVKQSIENRERYYHGFLDNMQKNVMKEVQNLKDGLSKKKDVELTREILVEYHLKVADNKYQVKGNIKKIVDLLLDYDIKQKEYLLDNNVARSYDVVSDRTFIDSMSSKELTDLGLSDESGSRCKKW